MFNGVKLCREVFNGVGVNGVELCRGVFKMSTVLNYVENGVGVEQHRGVFNGVSFQWC
jgi:hypothetical protein